MFFVYLCRKRKVQYNLLYNTMSRWIVQSPISAMVQYLVRRMVQGAIISKQTKNKLKAIQTSIIPSKPTKFPLYHKGIKIVSNNWKGNMTYFQKKTHMKIKSMVYLCPHMAPPLLVLCSLFLIQGEQP